MKLQRPFFFLVVCILSFYVESAGQKKSHIGAYFSGFPAVPQRAPVFVPKFSSKPIFISSQVPSFGKYLLTGIPGGSYYTSTLGVICRTELRLDKITPIPFRFRLGSLEYVNWMEGK